MRRDSFTFAVGVFLVAMTVFLALVLILGGAMPSWVTAAGVIVILCVCMLLGSFGKPRPESGEDDHESDREAPAS